ncbi:glycoside hydrolase family 43 protein [Tengunoibacter tsumagoiensis]|uniref:Glycoside hydrolase 43 family protein n=1 Tax=Tengunoibacter tsumagoiensis TaxID=2014871 RepID=A0A401ZZJ7_9CHLR|nr:glycoside hydrolase family 43 protein [Tengunoibacter tsumagoiensis]GCE12274.1 glycoside hydrolase 43 family protein [Tengunoibacter tsumagoiensis]
MHYNNPIIPGFHPDPSICRVGDDYFLVNSSFEYFPGVPLFHSRDLIHWEQIGHCLTRTSQLDLRKAWKCNGIFAPTIRYHQGTFYMITTNVSSQGNFFVTTQDPYGEWSDPIWFQHRGIDPSLYFDDDGTVYMTGSHNEAGFGATGILQCQLDITTGQCLTEPRIIWQGTGGKGPEGPHLFKKDGLYYLLIAEGGTEYGHMVTIARSTSPWGPFESCPHNPILSHRSLDDAIQITGHGDFVEDQQGNWWMVCLAVRPNGYPPCHHLGRETFLTPITWTNDGWPIITGGRLKLVTEAPCLPSQLVPIFPARDDFDQPQLRPYWNFLRNPDMTRYSLSERPGWLQLRGSSSSIAGKGAVTWLGRRQEHFICRITTLLDFEPQIDGEEAGLIVRMDAQHHYEIAVTRLEGEQRIIARRTIGTLSAIVANVAFPAGPIQLGIDATHDLYTLTFTAVDQVEQILARGETRYLSTEVAGGFTGVYFAIYASGNGQECQTPAYFDWFDYQPGLE